MSAVGAIVAGLGDVFRAELADGTKVATSSLDAFAVVAYAIGRPLETIMLLASDVAFVLRGTGREIGGIAAQIAAAVRGDFSQVAAIRQEMLADAGNAASELERYQNRIAGLTNKVLQRRDALATGAAVDTSGSDRKFYQGTAPTLKPSASGDEEKLLDIRFRLAGVTRSYFSDLKELNRAYQAGSIAEKEYIALASELATKTYAASEAGKAAAKSAREATSGARPAYNDGIDAQVEAVRKGLSLRSAATKDYVEHETALYRRGATAQLDFIGRIAERELASLQGNRSALVEELALQEKKRNSRKEQASLAGQIAAVDQQIAARGVRYADDENAALIAGQKAREDLFDIAQKAADAAQKQVDAARLEGQEIGLTTAALDGLKRARTEEAAARLESTARLVDEITLGGTLGDSYRAQAASIRELADLKSLNDARKSLDDFFDPSRAQTFGEALSGAFAGAGSALGGLMKALDDFGVRQAQIAAQSLNLKKIQDDAFVANENGDYGKSQLLNADAAAKAAKLAEASTRNQVSLYANAAGAAKGFFREGSTGYKTLQAAQQAFQAYQLASDIVTGTSAAAVAIAKQATGGDVYSAVFRMAAMAAVMASIGYSVSGSFGGTSAAERQETQNKGTVFGDSDAVSKSIAESYEQLLSTSQAQLLHQSGMLTALRSIDNSTKGLSNLVLRTAGLTSGNSFGVQEGTLAVNKGDPLLKMFGINDASLVKNIPLIGGVLTTLQSFFSKTKAEISDSGLSISGRVADLSQGRGVQQYADVKTQTSYVFGLFKGKPDYDTLFGPVDQSIAKQFALVFDNIGTALELAAGAMGKDMAAVGTRIADYVVDIPRESLRGLTGTELQDAVNGMISSAADKIAQATSAGLDQFQTIGEGYFQTVIRVSSGVETATAALEQFGVAAVDLGAVVNKQLDVATEIFRDSIIRAEARPTSNRISLYGSPSRNDREEGGLTGVGQIIRDMGGSVEDLTEAYASLLSIRGSLKSVGEVADVLSVAMLRGAGNMEKLASGLDSYLSKFFTSTEKTTAATARLAEEFLRIGVAMPTSNAGFRSLVEGIDLSSESGQRLYGQVITLSSAFAELYPLAGATADASKTLADAWKSIGDSITNEVRRIRGLLGQSSGASYASLGSQFATSTAAARAGDQEAAKALPAISQALLEAAKGVSATSEQYRVIQASTAASLEATQAMTAMWATQQGTAPTTPPTVTPGQPTQVVVQTPQIATFTAPAFDVEPLLAELKVLRAEVQMLNGKVESMASDQRAGLATVANNTSRSAKAAERVISDDGDSIAVTTRRDESVVTVI